MRLADNWRANLLKAPAPTRITIAPAYGLKVIGPATHLAWNHTTVSTNGPLTFAMLKAAIEKLNL